MDSAAITGLAAAIFFLSLGITDIGALLDPQSIYLVIGSTFGIMLYRSKLSDALALGGIVGKVFVNKTEEPDELIDTLTEIARVARKDGMIALERLEIKNKFLQKGVTSLVDGTKSDAIRESLHQQKKMIEERHEAGREILAAGAELAPGMGMIGTLIGLVNLLANLDDPSSIGPNMAIALLTTLYGSILANVFFIPMGMKLEGYSKRESRNNELIITGILFVKHGKNPRLMEDTLGVFVNPKVMEKRASEAGA
ncbi:MotA/TolQ/ExbB proton channel family protein [Porticoccaceae bacterium]|nr:MotA/TolQ/ExbB proton channel family protein [Porticoccaceae bacterium]MDA8663450.1 MotA/TolQ/ExbB proton channel family protein [Porticoccaceae bacterium]MDA8682282.1 MotA/TolQ/ExbB proton channel family protein [Porticoccaceae bacterium]MDB2343810.1 MotA/TolQ/ExbB proton channel family protein [Porticoccaceae bacterium]